MAGKYEFLKDARGGAAVDEPESVDVERRGGRPRSKSSDPRYRPITVVLQNDTIRGARRKLEDNNSSLDLSDLLQRLLAAWIQGEVDHPLCGRCGLRHPAGGSC